MKDIGASIGVNESRVYSCTPCSSSACAALGSETNPQAASKILKDAVVAFQQKPKMLKAQFTPAAGAASSARPGRTSVLPFVAPSQHEPDEEMAASWARMPIATAAEKPRARKSARRA